MEITNNTELMIENTAVIPTGLPVQLSDVTANYPDKNNQTVVALSGTDANGLPVSDMRFTFDPNFQSTTQGAFQWTVTKADLSHPSNSNDLHTPNNDVILFVILDSGSSNISFTAQTSDALVTTTPRGTVVVDSGNGNTDPTG